MSNPTIFGSYIRRLHCVLKIYSVSGSHSLIVSLHNASMREVLHDDMAKRGFVADLTLPRRVCVLYWAPKCPYSQDGAYLQISRKGHSRVPVYSGERENIVGVLFVKSLVMLDPDDNTPIRDIYRAGSFLTSSTSEPLFELLDKFQTGKSKCCFDVQSAPHEERTPCKMDTSLKLKARVCPCRLRSSRPKSESFRPKCLVKSPEMLNYLVRNLSSLNNILASLLLFAALVSSHRRL